MLNVLTRPETDFAEAQFNEAVQLFLVREAPSVVDASFMTSSKEDMFACGELHIRSGCFHSLRVDLLDDGPDPVVYHLYPSQDGGYTLVTEEVSAGNDRVFTQQVQPTADQWWRLGRAVNDMRLVGPAQPFCPSGLPPLDALRSYRSRNSLSRWILGRL